MKEGFEEAIAGILKEQEGLRELAAREAAGAMMRRLSAKTEELVKDLSRRSFEAEIMPSSTLSSPACRCLHPRDPAFHCDDCGECLTPGMWPICPHGRVGSGMQSGFGSYFDYGLGCEITSAGQRRQLMRQGTTVKGHFHKLDWKGRKVGMPGCEV